MDRRECNLFTCWRHTISHTTYQICDKNAIYPNLFFIPFVSPPMHHRVEYFLLFFFSSLTQRFSAMRTFSTRSLVVTKIYYFYSSLCRETRMQCARVCVYVRTRENEWEKNVWKYVEYAENWNSSKTTWRHGGRHTTWTMMRWYSVSLKAISASDKNSVASLLIDGKFFVRTRTLTNFGDTNFSCWTVFARR